MQGIQPSETKYLVIKLHKYTVLRCVPAAPSRAVFLSWVTIHLLIGRVFGYSSNSCMKNMLPCCRLVYVGYTIMVVFHEEKTCVSNSKQALLDPS